MTPYTLRRIEPADRPEVTRAELERTRRLSALRADAVAESRRLEPAIPEFGADGIPIRDELELIMEISQ